jgi:hypothetical protein
MDERGVRGGAINLNSTSYPDHGLCGDVLLQEKISTAEPEIEPGTSWLVVRSSDHQATRLVNIIIIIIIIIGADCNQEAFAIIRRRIFAI